MKKKILYIFILSLFLPVSSFAETVTTNTNNVPIQLEKNNPRVIQLIPSSTTITKNSADGEWYNITYNETTGWINRLYTSEGLAAKQEEDKKKDEEKKKNESSSSNTSYNGNGSYSTSSSKMERIVAAAKKYGKEYNLDPYLILAVIKTESNFNPNACSYANCRGLMQISYAYAKSWKIDRSRLYEIEYNIYHGTRLLSTWFIKQMGNTYDGLRAYNQGVAGAKKSSSNGKSYADKIMKYYNNYKKNGFKA